MATGHHNDAILDTGQKGTRVDLGMARKIIRYFNSLQKVSHDTTPSLRATTTVHAEKDPSGWRGHDTTPSLRATTTRCNATRLHRGRSRHHALVTGDYNIISWTSSR